VARRRRHSAARRRRDRGSGVFGSSRAAPCRGAGRGPAAAVRGDDPGPLPGCGVVGTVDDVGEAGPARWWPPVVDPADLAVAAFDRQLDKGWRRTSYSGLTRSLHDLAEEPGVASEPEAEERQDEPELPAPPEPPVLDLLDAA